MQENVDSATSPRMEGGKEGRKEVVENKHTSFLMLRIVSGAPL